MERTQTLAGREITHTDLVRFIVILSLSIACLVIAALSFSRNTGTIYIQLFYFPIIYATYFYPRRGVYFAGACALVYELMAYVYMYPDTGGMIVTSGQAILFICIAAVIAHFTEKINASETRYRSIFETSLLGIALFDQNTFTIRLANSHMAKILGYLPEDLQDLSFADLFVVREEQRRFFEFLGSSEDVSNFETRFLKKDKSAVWVNLSWRRVDENLVSCSVIDIDQKKAAEQEAGELNTQYRQVTENAPTCILILQENRIIFANPRCSDFTGYEPGELLDKEIGPLIHPDDRNAFPALPPSPSPETPLPPMAEVRFLKKDGDSRLGALFFSWVSRKGVPAILINLVDITEHERLKAAALLDRERRQGIISTVAHELRTPLQPIMGYLNLLMQDPQAYGVTDETRAILDRCARSVERESQVINQMLELSVIDTGKNPLAIKAFHVPALVARLIETGGYRAKAEVAVDLPPDLVIEADEDKIAFVIDAMLSNAVTYSKPPRKIRVSYQFSPSDQMHRLSIQDNGIGITNTQLDEIFEPFHLPESGTTNRKYDRIGLSLSIAKKYIQLHSGYISVDSIVNLGSTFTLHIPRQRPEAKGHGT